MSYEFTVLKKVFIFNIIFINVCFLYSQENYIYLKFEATDKERTYLLKCPESYSGNYNQFEYYEHLFDDTIEKILLKNLNYTGTISIDVSCKFFNKQNPFFELDIDYFNGKFIQSKTKYNVFDLFGKNFNSIEEISIIDFKTRIKKDSSIQLIDYDENGKIEYLDSTSFSIIEGKKYEKNQDFLYELNGDRKLFYQSEYLDGKRNELLFYDFSYLNYPCSINMTYKQDNLIDLAGENVFLLSRNKLVNKSEFLKLCSIENGWSLMELPNDKIELWKCNFVILYFSNETDKIPKNIIKKIRRKYYL